MWRKVKIAGSELLLKHNVSGDTHKVCLTNLVHLWFEEVSEETLLLRCKDLNKLLESTDEVFLSHIWTLVDSDSCHDDVTRDLAPTDGGKTLTLSTNLDGLKFRIKFLLVLANHSQFYEEVTQPFLTTICELNRRQQHLIDIIKTKDLEIEEYKLEGGQISRKAVQTEPFDVEVFSLKSEESISTSKNLVAASPCVVFTPPVQQLLDKISAAPIVKSEDNEEECRPRSVQSKKLVLVVKSPVKNKKQKMYCDDDDDEDNDDHNNDDINTAKEDTKKEQLKSPVKLQQISKAKQVLNNL